MILCWFLPYISMNQPEVYICPLPPSCSCPIPPLEVVAESWFEFPESYTKFPLAICFIFGSECFPCYSLHPSHPLLLAPVSTSLSVLYVCVSTGAG